MELVRKFIKKRTKSQVGIKLPELRTNTISVKWENEAERNLAEDFHSMLQFTHVSKSPTKINNSIAVMGHQAGSMILPLLIKARQMCILPSLVEKSLKHFTEIGLMEENKEALEALHKSSSKMDKVINTLIERKNNGRQKLIFCHFRGEIDYIKKSLEEQGQMKIMTLDGRTPEKERKEALSSENRIDVLILQIQTGCEGLNLQHFSEVYFVSPHWNPAVEDQAIARCHRMGQNSDVDVFRFAMAGFDEKNETRSLDEYASNLQDAKRDVMKIIDEEPDPIIK
jgi:SNF2 family DNA or RNA helicase